MVNNIPGLVQQRGPGKRNLENYLQIYPWQGGGVAGGGQAHTTHGNWFQSMNPPGDYNQVWELKNRERLIFSFNKMAKKFIRGGKVRKPNFYKPDESLSGGGLILPNFPSYLNELDRFDWKSILPLLALFWNNLPSRQTPSDQPTNSPEPTEELEPEQVLDEPITTIEPNIPTEKLIEEEIIEEEESEQEDINEPIPTSTNYYEPLADYDDGIFNNPVTIIDDGSNPEPILITEGPGPITFNPPPTSWENGNFTLPNTVTSVVVGSTITGAGIQLNESQGPPPAPAPVPNPDIPFDPVLDDGNNITKIFNTPPEILIDQFTDIIKEDKINKIKSDTPRLTETETGDILDQIPPDIMNSTLIKAEAYAKKHKIQTWSHAISVLLTMILGTFVDSTMKGGTGLDVGSMGAIYASVRGRQQNEMIPYITESEWISRPSTSTTSITEYVEYARDRFSDYVPITQQSDFGEQTVVVPSGITMHNSPPEQLPENTTQLPIYDTPEEPEKPMSRKDKRKAKKQKTKK